MLKLLIMSIKNILRKLNSRDTQILPSINTLTKIVFIALIAITATFFVKNILAADEKTIADFIKKQNAMTTGNNQETWINEAIGSNAIVGVQAIFGKIPEDVLRGKLSTNWSPGGLVGLTNNNIAALYNPPFSGVQYLASVKNNFLGKPAYAANDYQGLSGILPLWRGFRNATYAIFSIIFIAIGITIMLRVKISPQAVISIQSAIPNLVASLILVTFSYAIAGLLIDLSYVIEGLGISLILKASNSLPVSTAEIIKNPDVMGKIAALLPGWTLFIFSLVISGIVGAISALTGSFGILGIISMAVIWGVIGIIILWYTFKFFIGLTKCYITIILKTIIGPLEIALGAIPNMKMGFGSWFTNIIANVLVFPISIIFLVMLQAIIEATKGQSLWMPPGVDTLNLWAGISGGILPVAFGIGGLMIISKLPAMIPEFIFQIKPSPWGKAIGEGLTPYVKYGEKSVQGAKDQAKGKFMNRFTDVKENDPNKNFNSQGSPLLLETLQKALHKKWQNQSRGRH